MQALLKIQEQWVGLTLLHIQTLINTGSQDVVAPSEQILTYTK